MSMQLYAIAKALTPIWNLNPWESYNPKNKKFLASNKNIPLEMIAFKDTVFKIEKIIGDILQVSTNEYPTFSDNQCPPYNENKNPFRKPLYIDSDLVTITDVRLSDPEKVRLSREEILENLLSYEGTRYLWGGNVRGGISSCEKYYKQYLLANYDISDIVNLQRNLDLEGLDCSGLLYIATNGQTPRNTAQLIAFGVSLPIQGKSPEEIAEAIQPLDLIVWVGHVVIAVSQEETIESYGRDNFDGDPNCNRVVLRNKVDRLTEIMKTRCPVNSYCDGGFVINRWYNLPITQKTLLP